MFFIAYFLSFALVDGQSDERIHPLNTAVTAGKQFFLLCEKYSDNIAIIQWNVVRVNTYADRVVYNGTHLSIGFRSFHVHRTSNGISNLTKRFSSMDDAGTYKCIQKNGSNSVIFVSLAQVIVFATDPVCIPRETNILEGQHLEMNCSVNYAGSMSPVMKWCKVIGIDSNLDVNSTFIPGSSFISSILKLNVTRRDSNIIFQCTTYFNQPVISNEDNNAVVRKATNAPTYEHQCRAQINVLFEPEAVAITPRKKVYTLGDVLLCSAIGNPIPTYEWTELESNRIVSNEASLTVNSTAMENHAYKCSATNNATENGTSKISTTVTILAILLPLNDRTDVVRAVSIAAGAVFAILGLVVVCIACIKRLKARLNGDNAPQHDQTTDPENLDQQSSPYEMIDIVETPVGGEGGDSPVTPTEHREKSTNISNTTQRHTESQSPPCDPLMIPLQVVETGYAVLGNRSTPPSAEYQNLNTPEGPMTQEASTHSNECTLDKTTSVARDDGIYQDPDDVTYANVGHNYISLVG